MNTSTSKSITSLNNPELKFLISLSKNKIRKSEKKSLAEGYRENNLLISSNYEIDTLYICEDLFVGDNNYALISAFNKKNQEYVWSKINVSIKKLLFCIFNLKTKTD